MQSRLLKNILSVSGVLILVKALGFFKQMVIAGIFGANAETDLINLSYDLSATSNICWFK